MRKWRKNMYYPYLRGRQNELLGLQELLESGRLKNSIIPVVEPVRFNTTFLNTIKKFAEQERPIILIKNPKVGKYDIEYTESRKKDADNEEKLKEYEKILNSPQVINAYLTKRDVIDNILSEKPGYDKSIYLINTSNGDYQYYEEYGDKLNVGASFIPKDNMDFKDEVNGTCIALDASYHKKKRNIDYIKEPDEFFSKNHLTFAKRGYQGFSD